MKSSRVDNVHGPNCSFSPNEQPIRNQTRANTTNERRQTKQTQIIANNSHFRRQSQYKSNQNFQAEKDIKTVGNIEREDPSEETVGQRTKRKENVKTGDYKYMKGQWRKQSLKKR